MQVLKGPLSDNELASATAPSKIAPRYLTVLLVGFLLFVIAFLAALEWVGRETGATVLPRKMAAAQNENADLVVLPGEIRHWASLKLARIAEEQPEVVLIGSSRGNEVRSAMFRPYRFYNASLTAWNLKQMLEMLDQVTRVSKPRVIILSLDYFMFGDSYADSVSKQRSMYFDNDLRVKYESEIYLLRSLHTYPELWRDRFPAYLFGLPPAKPDGLKLLGLDAVRAEAGFRWDGSFLYESGTLANALQTVRERRGLIDAMEGWPFIAPRQMAELEKIAALGRERRLRLIGIQWPLAQSSIDCLERNYVDGLSECKDSFWLWKDFQSREFAAKLKSLGIEFFDLAHLYIGRDDRNFIDAAHPNEGGMLKAFIRLSEDQRFQDLLPAIDLHALRQTRDEASKKDEYSSIYGNQY